MKSRKKHTKDNGDQADASLAVADRLIVSTKTRNPRSIVRHAIASAVCRTHDLQRNHHNVNKLCVARKKESSAVSVSEFIHCSGQEFT